MMTRDALSSYLSFTRPTKIRFCTGIIPLRRDFSFFCKKGKDMSWRTIYITESERLGLYLDNLLVIKNGEEYKIPLKDIGSVIVEDNRTVITLKLINKILKYNILLIFCDDKYNPIGILNSTNGYFRQSKIVNQQINWDRELKDILWKEIVKVKLQNQNFILKKLEKDNEVVENIEKYIQEVEKGDITNREGLGAKIYFRELYGATFIRGDKDVINSALNYGYTIIHSKIARVIAGKGLLTYLGIHHKSEYNQFNLASDIIEVYRPLVDYFVYIYMKHASYFSKEDRVELINLLNAKVLQGRYMESVSNSIEKYIDMIIEFFETGVFDIEKIPSLSKFEFYEL